MPYVLQSRGAIGDELCLITTPLVKARGTSCCSKCLSKVLENRWSNLVCQQWRHTKKWITYDNTTSKQPIQGPTGIPQGDSASPLLLGLLLAFGVHQAEQQVKQGSTQRLYQLVYMDDRTLIANDQRLLHRAISTWEQFAKYVHLLENKSKMQEVNLQCPNSPQHMEVLGTMIGLPGKTTFYQHAKHQQRIKAAKYTTMRISLLPIRQTDRLISMNLFAKSKANYGWLTGLARPSLIKSYDTLVSKCAGKLAMGIPAMRSLLVGTAIELRMSVLTMQVHTLAHRQQMQKELSLRDDGGSRLDYMVYDGLENLGWSRQGNRWQHEVLPFKFTLAEVCQDVFWKKTAHAIRQSFRWRQWQLLPTLNRREFRDLSALDFPAFSEERLNLAQRWAKHGGGSLAVACGACPSALLRNKLWNEQWKCQKCGELNPPWEHYWTCCMSQQPPADILQRRFLWPINKEDHFVGVQFLEAMKLVQPLQDQQEQ